MKIFFVNNAKAGTQLDFSESEISIGRGDDNLLSLDARGISRHHGLIYQENGDFYIKDLGSTNGIKLNAVAIQGATAIKNGDIIEFGEQLLQINDLTSSKPKVIFNKFATATPGAEPKVVAPPELEKESVKSVTKPFLSGETNIFGKRNKSTNNEISESGRRSLFSNRLFYTIVICGAVVAIAMFYKVVSSSGEKAKAASTKVESAKDFLLFYEKQVLSPDNVFKFVLHIENGSAVFTIDDLKSQRRYEKRQENLELSDLELLRSRLQRSGFMAVRSPQQGSVEVNNQKIRRLVIGNAKMINDVSVVNNTAPQGFSDMEDAIDEFAENYGLQTISMTPKELKDEAQRSFNKAEDLFANQAAEAKNLRNAILRYKITVDYLEQFSPKPDLWKRADAKLKRASQMRAQKYSDLDMEAKRLLKFKEYDALRYVYLQQMDLSDMNSREYRLARSRLFKLDRYLNGVKK